MVARQWFGDRRAVCMGAGGSPLVHDYKSDICARPAGGRVGAGGRRRRARVGGRKAPARDRATAGSQCTACVGLCAKHLVKSVGERCSRQPSSHPSSVLAFAKGGVHDLSLSLSLLHTVVNRRSLLHPAVSCAWGLISCSIGARDLVADGIEPCGGASRCNNSAPQVAAMCAQADAVLPVGGQPR